MSALPSNPNIILSTSPSAMYHSSLHRPSRISLELAYLVSNVELANTVSLLHNLSNKLMAADEVGRAFEVSSVEV
jgi:hypothetical protein